MKHIQAAESLPTLRDQFAMSALQGLLVNNWRSEMSDELFTQQHTAWLTQCWRHGNENCISGRGR